MSIGDYVRYNCRKCGLDNLPGPKCPDCGGGEFISDGRELPDPDSQLRPAQPLRVYTLEELDELAEKFPGGLFSVSELIRIRLRQLLEKPGTAVALRQVAHEFVDAKYFPNYRRASVRIRSVVQRTEGFKLDTRANCTFIVRPIESEGSGT